MRAETLAAGIHGIQEIEAPCAIVTPLVAMLGRLGNRTAPGQRQNKQA